MIYLTFIVDQVNTVMLVYDQIRVQRSDSADGIFTTISGLGPINLVAGVSSYTLTDADGIATNWYRSQYYSTSTTNESGWSDPILGDPGDIYYCPLYPPEISYGTEDQLIIENIRRLIGDPVSLLREYGEDAISSIHPDGKTYELDSKGWPADIHVNNVAKNETTDPIVNGYKYLKFREDVSSITTISGISYGIDIWYYTFRNSDREIMEAYDNVYPPAGLTTSTATSEIYMLQVAIDILSQELIEDSIVDGATITDSDTSYNPSPGLNIRDKLISRLQKRLDDLVKRLLLGNITGVLID